MRQLFKPSRGTALVIVVVTLGILTAITGTVVFAVMNRFHTLHQSSAWEEALTAAEAGVHQSLAQLERALDENVLPTGAQTFTLNMPHAGETSTQATAEYTLRRNNLTVSSRTLPFYSVVSTGRVNMGGSRAVSSDQRDVVLRKLNLRGPQGVATRTIEAWIKPVFSTDTALKVDKLITLNNHKIYVDSFDSSDPQRSISGQPGNTIGQFNVAPYNVLRAHIATNSQFIAAGNATVYGDALTNGGTVGGAGGIQGEVRDDFYQPLAPVHAPAWATSVTPGINNSRGTRSLNITSATTLYGGTVASPARYVVDSIRLVGSSDILTFTQGLNGNNGSVDPNRNQVELYVRGDISTKGGGNSADSGTVVIKNGMQVKIWFLGSVNFSGNGVANNNGFAANLGLYGVNAPTPTPDQSVTLAGSPRFFGTVYAPGADLRLAGGGSDGTFVGSLVAKSASLNGRVNVRYDESLAGSGLISRFELQTWFEDTKKQGSFPGTF
jgi:hypothetical protein